MEIARKLIVFDEKKDNYVIWLHLLGHVFIGDRLSAIPDSGKVLLGIIEKEEFEPFRKAYCNSGLDIQVLVYDNEGDISLNGVNDGK